MYYTTFVKKMREQVQEQLGEKYQVEIVTNSKLNGAEKTGLTIRRMQEPQQVVPVLYLEECYEQYLKDQNFTECVEVICTVYENQKGNEETIMTALKNMENVRSWEQIKDRIFPMIVSERENENLKEQYVYKNYLDFLVLYIVRISEVEIGNIKITNKMLEMWGISAEELDNQAMDNMKTDGYQVKGMRRMLQESCLEMMGDIVEEEDEVMYVLTNKEKYFGAAGIFFCAELFQKVIGTNNFYILPSSVHELILVKDDSGCDMQELNAMVRCVNEEQVDIDERLSDHAYYYDWKQNRVIF